MATKKYIQNEERSKCLWGILCTKLYKIPSMLKENWSPEDELHLKSQLNLKQKIVHSTSKNTSNIFLSSLLTFFTDNDVNYLDLWNTLSWIQQIWGQFCLAFIEKVYVRKKCMKKKHLQGLVKLTRFSCKSSPPQIITLGVARQIARDAASYNFHSILTKILTAFIPTLLREVKLDFTSKQHLLKQKCYK